jgi:hypothetical protein
VVEAHSGEGVTDRLALALAVTPHN